MAGDWLINQASLAWTQTSGLLMIHLKLFIAYQYFSFKAFLFQLLLVTDSGIPK